MALSLAYLLCLETVYYTRDRADLQRCILLFAVQIHFLALQCTAVRCLFVRSPCSDTHTASAHVRRGFSLFLYHLNSTSVTTFCLMMAYQSYSGGPQLHHTPSSASMYNSSPASSSRDHNVGRTASMACNSSAHPLSRSSPRQQLREQVAPPPCPAGVDAKLWTWFHIVDTDGSGSITPHELQQALINGDHSKFDKDTIAMLFGMFDVDRNGMIGFNE